MSEILTVCEGRALSQSRKSSSLILQRFLLSRFAFRAPERMELLIVPRETFATLAACSGDNVSVMPLIVTCTTLSVYSVARRLTAIGDIRLYEYICKIWTSKLGRFILDPIYQMPEMNA